MLFVTTQDGLSIYRIYYYHLQYDVNKDEYHMIGFDRDSTNLVDLGTYKFYQQAIDVFSEMSYLDNDLIYFRTKNKTYVMPENITDPKLLPKVSI